MTAHASRSPVALTRRDDSAHPSRRYPAGQVWRSCPGCGQPSWMDARATYCSVPCRQRAYRSRKREGRTGHVDVPTVYLMSSGGLCNPTDEKGDEEGASPLPGNVGTIRGERAAPYSPLKLNYGPADPGRSIPAAGAARGDEPAPTNTGGPFTRACSSEVEAVGQPGMANGDVTGFYRALLWELGEHARSGGTAYGAAVVAKRVCREWGARVTGIPLPRPSRAEEAALGRGRYAWEAD